MGRLVARDEDHPAPLSARNQKVDYDYETWGPLKEEKQYPTASATTPDRTITYGRDPDGNVTSHLRIRR